MRVLTAVRAFPPHGWIAFGAQLALLFAVNAVYEIGRALLEGDAAVATAHALDIVRAERALGIFVERDIQRLATDAPGWVMDTLIWTYRNCQRLITWSFVIWLYLRRNDHYRAVRNTIFAVDAIGLAGYFLYPTAPPRLTAGFGFVDSLDPLQENLRSSLVGSLTNLYAAVPSLHTAYALLFGIVGWRACRHLVFRVAWACYPGLVVLATVATGNHWLLDAVAGAAALGVAALVASTISRRLGAATRPAAPPDLAARSAEP